MMTRLKIAFAFIPKKFFSGAHNEPLSSSFQPISQPVESNWFEIVVIFPMWKSIKSEINFN